MRVMRMTVEELLTEIGVEVHIQSFGHTKESAQRLVQSLVEDKRLIKNRRRKNNHYVTAQAGDMMVTAYIEKKEDA